MFLLDFRGMCLQKCIDEGLYGVVRLAFMCEKIGSVIIRTIGSNGKNVAPGILQWYYSVASILHIPAMIS